MTNSYDLSKLDPDTFENLITSLATNTLGAGTTGFGPGSDGGRDTYFEGEANYPSQVDRWKGTWYIQSKFHRPHLSKNSQAWLIQQVTEELRLFQEDDTKRIWPDIWILATNIDPSATPETGSWDKIKFLVKKANPKMKFDIWGGKKILNLLRSNSSIAKNYSHFLTPGDVLSQIKDSLNDEKATIEHILNYLIVNKFNEQIHTKLDQAGSAEDNRPGIHQLFIDLPYSCKESSVDGDVLTSLVLSSARNHRPSAADVTGEKWQKWIKSPIRARVLVLKGGPGQGKSTIGQYYAQVHRAALIEHGNLSVPPKYKSVVEEVKRLAISRKHFPLVPRIPVLIELKDFAQWYGRRSPDDSKGVITYLCSRIQIGIEIKVLPITLRRALSIGSWFFIFDGLDEVPNDVKDAIATEIRQFLDDFVYEVDADLMALCTSRPQGYSGQFDSLDGPVCDLKLLSAETALSCCKHIVEFGRQADDALRFMEILKIAITSPGVRELMTTPLQSHIMAVVVRSGGKPPERRWQLFYNYYNVMKKREVLKNFSEPRIAKLLSEQEKLLKSIHSLLGFSLHVRAETSDGAETQLSRDEFKELVRHTVTQLIDEEIEETVNALMEATTERLVFVNTPDSAQFVRFDIRQLQEFFASEFLYEGVTINDFGDRLKVVGGDSHWAEVMHFLLSSLIENSRTSELSIAIQQLDDLNHMNLDGTTRGLHMRLARGAFLSLRLILEGVLDQDKKIRNQFRTSLQPLLGILEREVVIDIISIREGETRNWLTNFLYDTLNSLNESENINSIIALGYLLKNNDNKIF